MKATIGRKYFDLNSYASSSDILVLWSRMSVDSGSKSSEIRNFFWMLEVIIANVKAGSGQVNDPF